MEALRMSWSFEEGQNHVIARLTTLHAYCGIQNRACSSGKNQHRLRDTQLEPTYYRCSVWSRCIRECLNHGKHFLMSLFCLLLHFCDVCNSIDSLDLDVIGCSMCSWRLARSLTLKQSNACFSPFLQSLSNVLICPWRKNALNLVSFCWASTKEWIL
jgi:hypothetical protein